MKKRQGYQQGDVLLVRTSNVPSSLRFASPKVETEEKGYVLFEGEHSGHIHAFVDTNKIQVAVTPEGRRFVKVLEEVGLFHNGHYARTIAPDIYEIDRVNEIDPYSKEKRKVED